MQDEMLRERSHECQESALTKAFRYRAVMYSGVGMRRSGPVAEWTTSRETGRSARPALRRTLRLRGIRGVDSSGVFEPAARTVRPGATAPSARHRGVAEPRPAGDRGDGHRLRDRTPIVGRGL